MWYGSEVTPRHTITTSPAILFIALRHHVRRMCFVARVEKFRDRQRKNLCASLGGSQPFVCSRPFHHLHKGAGVRSFLSNHLQLHKESFAALISMDLPKCPIIGRAWGSGGTIHYFTREQFFSESREVKMIRIDRRMKQ